MRRASGKLCCAPFVISTAALALSFVANSTCNLVAVNNSDFFYLPAKTVGLWCYSTLGGAIYSTVNVANFDETFQAARGVGTATLILGIIVWLFYCFAGFCPFTPIIFQIVGFLCVCNTIFQALVFLVYRSKICWDGCSLDTAGYCAIAAAVLWLIAGIFSCMSGKPAEEIEEPGDEEENHGAKEDDSESAEENAEEQPVEDQVDDKKGEGDEKEDVEKK